MIQQKGREPKVREKRKKRLIQKCMFLDKLFLPCLFWNLIHFEKEITQITKGRQRWAQWILIQEIRINLLSLLPQLYSWANFVLIMGHGFGLVVCCFFFFLSFYNFACFCCLALGYFTMIKFFGSKQGIGNSEKASFFFFFWMNFM